MKFRRFSKFISVLLVFTLTSALLPFTSIGSEDIANAASTSHGAIDNYEAISKINAEGTETNPFVILEIVPNEAYAEIGYTIAGCEPVDIKKLETEEAIKAIEAFGSASISATKSDYFKFELEPDDIPAQWTDMGEDKISLPGYYKKVAVGEGQFIQVANPTTDGAFDYSFRKEANGDFIWVNDDTPIESVPESDKDNLAPAEGDKVYTTREDTYFKSLRYTYTNNNLFLKNVMGLTTDTEIKNYHVIVKTITPDELAMGTNEQWIDQADLIYINSNSHANGVTDNMVELWKNYNIFGKTAGWQTSFGQNDLTWSATMKILERAIGLDPTKKVALMIDKRIGSDVSSYVSNSDKRSFTPREINYEGKATWQYSTYAEAYNNNMYKLFLMTQVMDARSFYNLFVKNYSTTPTSSSIIQEVDYNWKKTGSCTIQGDDASNTQDMEIFWNAYTFMFTKKDGSRAGESDWTTDDMWNAYRLNHKMDCTDNVNGFIYAYDGTVNIATLLDNPATVSAASEPKYTKVLEGYADDVPGGASIHRGALAIKYICSDAGKYKGIKNTLKVLELQPCDDYTLKEYNIRMMVPQFIGKIELDQQTTAEFNGKIDDLNCTYHMIYIGMNFGKYNTGNVYHDGVNETLPVYTDPDLKGKIYLHVGDRLYTEDVWSSLTPKNYVRLPGNDITERKKEQLIGFLKGGYPVVVQHRMYTCDQLTIDKTSQIYDLVNSNKGTYSNILDESVSDYVSKVSECVKAYKPEIVLETNGTPVPYVGITDTGLIPDSAYINGSNINNRTLRYSFKIDDGGLDREYKTTLLIDVNGDGRYEEPSGLNTYSEIVTKRYYRSDGKVNTFTKTLSTAFVGVIPWQLKIVDTSNPNKRAVIKGISAVKRTADQKIEIKILQVNQPPTTLSYAQSTLNLENNFATNGNFWKYTKDLNDFKITFKTITTKDFEHLYDAVPFDKTNETTKENTDKLKEYDMIIFGFADYYENISNYHNALDNVLYYIDQGRSVMFTHDVTSYNNEGSPEDFGKDFNKKMRGYLGMDRFGYRDSAIINKDYCTNPKNGTEYSEKQGWTYSGIFRMIPSGSSNKRIFKDLPYNPGTFTGDKVSKINDGQLTQYPYQIADGNSTFKVATTHNQYYQLNLENEDLVVWYALSDGNKLFSESPNDASNNYYIYSKGNIMYTGVGHSAMNSEINEVKLFVNSMVAAYKNGKQRATINVTSEDSFLGKDNKFYTYINSDTEIAATSGSSLEFENADVMDIAFMPIEFNFLSGELGVMIKDVPDPADPADVEKKYKIYKVNSSGVKVEMTDSFAGSSDYVKLLSDEEYVFEYVKSDFNKKNSEEFTFYLVDSNGEPNEITLKLLRRSLFKLN